MRVSAYFLLAVKVTLIVTAPVDEEDNSNDMLDESWFDYESRKGEYKENSLESEFWLFEGDLEISYQQYKDHYLQSASAMGATNNDDLLWKEGGIYGYVYYKFHNTEVKEHLKHRIREVMDYMEDETCLRFFGKKNNYNYILFRTEKDVNRCESNSIGRVPASNSQFEQVINLGKEKHKCQEKGTIIHEIGHAIGFWHEQSRPDRDNYIDILWNNIPEKYHKQFGKKTNEIDSRGSTFDYGSIMMYELHSLLRTFHSMDVKDPSGEYTAQGKPFVGQRKKLSKRDIEQIKLMYRCTNTGIRGQLSIKISSGTVNFIAGLVRPYVRVTAVDVYGNKVVRSTDQIIVNSKKVSSLPWNVNLMLGPGEWKFFRIQLMDDYKSQFTLEDIPLTISETVIIEAGTHSRSHCMEPDDCNTAKIDYDYSLHQDCLSKPCQNGGKCVQGISSYQCVCQRGYEGHNCEIGRGVLHFWAMYGVNLPEANFWSFFGDHSNPYIKVIAHHKNGEVERETKVAWNTVNPNWYQDLDFGKEEWTHMEVRVFSRNRILHDDSLSPWKKYKLSPGIHLIHITQSCYDNGGNEHGYIMFNYEIVDQRGTAPSGCATHPCMNGGTCTVTSGNTLFTCTCANGYYGHYCEHNY